MPTPDVAAAGRRPDAEAGGDVLDRGVEVDRGVDDVVDLSGHPPPRHGRRAYSRAAVARALDGIRILDFSRVVAGPACTHSLVNLGADVVKVEPPEGDLMRRARPRRDGISLYFAQVNCGKRCISLDLDRPEGQHIAAELARHVDVIVENFRPGVMARMGLDPAELRAARPELIVCSISGYGQTGASAQRRAYAPVIHAELGLIELGTHRGTPPVPEPVSHADFAVAAQATSAILAALFHRQRTGEGQHVDVSMAETMLAVMEWTRHRGERRHGRTSCPPSTRPRR